MSGRPLCRRRTPSFTFLKLNFLPARKAPRGSPTRISNSECPATSPPAAPYFSSSSVVILSMAPTPCGSPRQGVVFFPFEAQLQCHCSPEGLLPNPDSHGTWLFSQRSPAWPALRPVHASPLGLHSELLQGMGGVLIIPERLKETRTALRWSAG